MLYSRACGRDGDCRYTTTGDCNTYDGPYLYPQCWMATGGGEIDSSSCPAGVEPTTDGFTHDYKCVEIGSSARCELNKLATETPICNDQDHIISPPEVCDGTNLNSKTCQSEGFSGGTLKCGTGCTSFDTSGCNNCGNNVCNAGETPTSCPADCKCGNNVCDAVLGETKTNCAADCKCGNGDSYC